MNKIWVSLFMNSYGWKHFFYLCLQKLSFSKSLTSLFINFWNFKTNELLSAISPKLIIGSLYNPWVCGYHYFIINGKKSVSFLSSSEAKAGVSFMNGPRKKIKYLPSSFKLKFILTSFFIILLNKTLLLILVKVWKIYT